MMNRNPMIQLFQIAVAASMLLHALAARGESARPNIVLMMCDDLGWGDTGFNGHPIIKTPQLDRMAKEGAVLNHFYSIGPVCSPTRASFLTGRHYYRMGVWTANAGHLPRQEFTIARMLKAEGYATGHFGKWHLGTLNKTVSAKGPRRMPAVHYAPPWERDYDRSFVTESAVQTWNPAAGQRAVNNPYYENGTVATKNLDGCDSRVLMDRAISFIRDAAENDTPFVAIIWFHAPHEDIVAGPEYLKMYEGHGSAAHYYGCITAVDDQVGRLRAELESLGVKENTALFFCSDNGPEGAEPKDRSKTRRAGSSGGFRGRKRSLYEGGVRVPSIACWANHIEPGTIVDVPCSVLDYLPTVQAMTGATVPSDCKLDGQDLMPIVQQKTTTHARAIPFRYGDAQQDKACLVEGKLKLVIRSLTAAETDELYDLSSDRAEAINVLGHHPVEAARMRNEILEFLRSAEQSHAGADYGDAAYQPTDEWRPLGFDDQPQ